MIGLALIPIILGIGLLFIILGFFIGHIIIFDSILFSIIGGVCANKFLHIHPAISLIIGIGLLIFLFWVQNTRFGFWIISVLLSGFWAFIFSTFAYALSNADPVWVYTIMGLGFVAMMILHIQARDKTL